jgi:hypothetical protein
VAFGISIPFSIPDSRLCQHRNQSHRPPSSSHAANFQITSHANRFGH